MLPVSHLGSRSTIDERGNTHPRKVLGGFGVAEQVKHHGGNSVLAVIVVGVDSRMVIVVRYASFADIKPNQSHARVDRRVQLLIVDSGFARHDEGYGQRQAWRVDCENMRG